MSVDAEYTISGGLGPDAEPTTGTGTPIGSGLTDPAGAADHKVEDHCEEAIARLLHQFHGKTRLENLVCVFGDQVQALEEAFWQLFTERTLANSSDAQLDGIGEIVGEARKARTDANYRVALSVRILVNKSNGKVEELYTIIRTAQGVDVAVTILEGDMALSVEISDPLVNMTAAELVALLRQAKMDGVRLDLVTTYSDDADTFEFSSTTEGEVTDNATGVGSTTNGTWGGDLSSVT